MRQANEDDMVYTRILSVDNNLSMDDKSDIIGLARFSERKNSEKNLENNKHEK